MKRQISQFVALLLLVLIFVGGLVFVMPLRTNVEAAQLDLDEKAGEVQLLQSEYDTLKVLADEVAKSAAKRDTLLDAVPVGHKQDELLLELTGLTADLNFGVNAINFALSNSQDVGNTIVITANFEGKYDDLIDFLKQLENADRLFQVKSISAQLTSSTDVVFNLNIEAYYQ